MLVVIIWRLLSGLVTHSDTAPFFRDVVVVILRGREGGRPRLDGQ